MFGRLILEINQAGVSWTTILNKQEHFRKAYSNSDVQIVAKYGDQDWERHLGDAGIIHNRLKINAAIHDARQIISLQQEFASFKNWLDHRHLLALQEWVKLLKKTFKFTGGEITKEFLMSSGYLQGAHVNSCPFFHEVLERLDAPTALQATQTDRGVNLTRSNPSQSVKYITIYRSIDSSEFEKIHASAFSQ